MATVLGSVTGLITCIIGIAATILNDKLVGAGLTTAGIAILYSDQRISSLTAAK